MRKVKIHCIKARAERLNQPEMLIIYEEFSIVWDEENDICELSDEDHREVNKMWKEKGSKEYTPKPCKSCGGIR